MFNVMLRYAEEINKSFYYEPPDWSLSHETIWETPNLKLLCFQNKNRDKKPIFVIPPNAGHHSNIAEKLINLIAEYGFPVYSIEWLNASSCRQEEKDYSIADMTSDISSCVEKIGEPAHFFSLCQGAWASAISISLSPEIALSYTNAAGPINFQDSNGKIENYTEMLPMNFFEAMVAMNGGIQSGDFQIAGFKNLNPIDRWVGDYMELFEACQKGDEEKINKWHRFKRWYEYGVDLAGSWYLEAVKRLFKENQLFRGEFLIKDQVVDLKNIACPVFLIAGENDDITLSNQVFDLKQKTATTKEFLIEEVGHIGVFTSRRSVPIWKEILNTLN